MQGLGSRGCHQHRIQTVLAGDRGLLVINNGVCECLHLGNERAGVSVPHDLVGYAVNRAVRSGQNSGVRGVVLVLGTAFRAEYLNALVVTVNCLAAVVDDTDCTVCELQGNESGVYVACLADAREPMALTSVTSLPARKRAMSKSWIIIS